MGYNLIESVRVGAGGATTIDFTGIPQSGNQIMVKLSLRATGTNQGYCFARMNNNTGAVYEVQQIQGDGGSLSSVKLGFFSNTLRAGTTNCAGDTSTATFANSQFIISDYTSSGTKVASFDGAKTDNNTTTRNAFYQAFGALEGLNIGAVNQLTFYQEQGDFAENSVISLYVINND